MLEFKTLARNMYAWDENVGLFIPFSPTMSAVVNLISDQESISLDRVIGQLKDNYNREEIAFCYDWIKKWEKIKPLRVSQVPQRVPISDLKRYLLKHGLSQLILTVTEDCNFRCKYCVYSDAYEYTRSHSNKYMDFTTAKKAIDYYFSMIKQAKRYHPLKTPTIGFYGGEPLLNFNLIKKCFEYIEDTYSDFQALYGLTTNGSLLDKEKADWLMRHNFSISVSLDGPEDEHNRLRVYRSGKGTFKDVMRNIGSIMEFGYKNIVSLPVFDWKSDLFKNEEFFNRNDTPTVANVAQVNDIEWGKYYDQFTEEDKSAFLKRIKRIKDYYFEKLSREEDNKRSSYFDRLVGDSPVDDLLGGFSVYSREHSVMPFTGACVPGTKIFVDVDGNFHACERVTNDFPIGNIDEGLNFERIYQLIENYINSMDKCPSCKNNRKCSLCYTIFMTDNGFTRSSKICQKIEDHMKKSFSETFSLAEINPKVLEVRYKHKNIRKYYGD